MLNSAIKIQTVKLFLLKNNVNHIFVSILCSQLYFKKKGICMFKGL